MTPSPSAAGTPLVVYYSRTGNTRRLAERVSSHLRDVDHSRDVVHAYDVDHARDVDHLESPRVERIRPATHRSYPNWLARSAIPGSRVAIDAPEVDPGADDAVFLGTPKWTLSCPPVTQYVAQAPLQGTRVGVFLTFGGFDQERYLRSLVRTLREAGASVQATLAVQRDRVADPDLEDDVAAFCAQVLDA